MDQSLKDYVKIKKKNLSQTNIRAQHHYCFTNKKRGMLRATENDQIVQEGPAKRRAPDRLNSENGLTHEMKCLKRVIEVKKALIEDLKE